MPTRRIYGYVYELVLTPPHQDPDPDVSEYVGKARSMARRMAKTGSGHRSPTSIAKDPWKAYILPGRDGYRILETVYEEDTEAESEDHLRRAENYWIAKMHAKRNDVRPIKPRGYHAPATLAKPARKLSPAQQRARSRATRRAWWFASLWLTSAVLIARVFATSDVAWSHPATPWVATAVLSTVTAWAVFWWSVRTARRFTRGTR